MIYEANPLQEPVAIDGQPIAKLLDNLKHPIDGVRYRTRIELSEHPTEAVAAAASNRAPPPQRANRSRRRARS